MKGHFQSAHGMGPKWFWVRQHALLAASRSQCLLKREFRHAQVVTGAEVWALKTFFPRSSIHYNLPILNSDSSRFKEHTENATFVEPVLFEMEHIRE